MAITKIHPIKSTLNLAIGYITKDEKTDDKVLVSSFYCEPTTAHTKFMMTRKDAGTRGTVLARHLIQSFLPGETSPERAHEIGLELCKRVLKDEYEFVLATHVDRGHIHNHIIFNNVNMVSRKCYQSNKRSYHQIRNHSDDICKENRLSVIDEHYEKFKRKYKTAGKSWYEDQQHKQGTSWKSKLQFDIDRTVRQSKDWDEFLKKMADLGYEIKFGKHIAFRHEDKQRFTRTKTIGEDYIEERLKERISDNDKAQGKIKKREPDKIIDISANEKIKSSKGYEIWARKHNLKVMADSVISLRDEGIKSLTQLEKSIQEKADARQDLSGKIKVIESKMSHLSNMMEHAHTITKYREIYKYHKENPKDKHFENEYSAELAVYKVATNEILKHYKKLPNTKEILKELDKLNEEKSKLMPEYTAIKSDMDKLFTLQKNYKTFKQNDLER